jgi:anti-sigma B factor antagonist
MAGVELETSTRDGHVVVALRGELDVSGAAGVEAAIAAAVVPGQSLIIDMSALDFLDCASLGALLRVQGLARSFGGDVVLAGPPRRARRLLVLSGQDQVFRVHPSVEAAVASIGSRRRLYAVPGPR